MTEAQLRASGKNGVYRADLDEWFVEGEEPQPVAPAVIAPEPKIKKTTLAEVLMNE